MDIDMEPDTTVPSYWFNWRFLICAIWILATMVFAAILIWRYGGPKKSENQPSGVQSEANKSLYMNEAWGTCSISIHPLWLLAYRIISFIILLGLLIADITLHSAGIFYFYTEWTFMLVTIYFALASSLSIFGCLYCREKVDPEKSADFSIDPERGPFVAPTTDGNTDISSLTQSLNLYREKNCRTAFTWGHALQIIFQICAGAVALTDSVFWLILYPMYTSISFLDVCMHSVNALLVGDAILNRLRFPIFGIAYFILWTDAFVIFQWILHACVSMWWPYAFLDLSDPYAPLWYLGVGLMHLPCFGIFAFIFRIKRWCQSV